MKKFFFKDAEYFADELVNNFFDLKLLIKSYNKSEDCDECKYKNKKNIIYNFVISLIEEENKHDIKKLFNILKGDYHFYINGKWMSKDEILIQNNVKSLPPFFEVFLNLFRSICRIIYYYIFNRDIYASKEEMERRELICKSCDLYNNGRCLECGCYIKQKIKYKKLHCGINKW